MLPYGLGIRKTELKICREFIGEYNYSMITGHPAKFQMGGEPL